MTVDMHAFDELRAAVAERKGQALLDYAAEHEGGTAGLLDEIFGTMPKAFLPDKARGQSADFQYRIKAGEEQFEYFVRIHDGACETGRGTVDDPRVTMTVGLPEFLRLITGKLHGMQAFLTGKVKISGDTFYAGKFDNWFARP